MKYMMLLLLLPCLTMAQKNGNNAIIIPNINKQQVIKVFKENGYRIDKATKQFVATVPQSAFNKTIEFTMTIEDSISYLMGAYDGNSISFTGGISDSTAGKKANAPFLLMDSLARSFGKPVKYTTNM